MDALKGVKTNKKQKEETNNKTPSKGRMEYLKKAKRQGLINELDDLLTSARYHFMSKQSLYKALKQILSIIDIYGDAGPTEGALKTEYNNAFYSYAYCAHASGPHYESDSSTIGWDSFCISHAALFGWRGLRTARRLSR